MLICELTFDQPDPKNPDYSLEEVDYYAWIPTNAQVPNHRLSLRKNLKTGFFEVYRHYAQRRVLIAPEVLVVTHEGTGQEETAFEGAFADALEFANSEYEKWHHADQHKDNPCQHQYPNRAWRCPGAKKRP
jgi:hypothetical protein